MECNTKSRESISSFLAFTCYNDMKTRVSVWLRCSSVLVYPPLLSQLTRASYGAIVNGILVAKSPWVYRESIRFSHPWELTLKILFSIYCISEETRGIAAIKYLEPGWNGRGPSPLVHRRLVVSFQALVTLPIDGRSAARYVGVLKRLASAGVEHVCLEGGAGRVWRAIGLRCRRQCILFKSIHEIIRQL